MADRRTPGKQPSTSSRTSGTKTFDAKKPVRFAHKSALHLTPGQVTTLKRARKAS